MQVQAINTPSNLGFGAIYKPKNVNYNKVQEPIVDAIKTAMREPLQKFNGNTAEAFYKSKGFDFEISPQAKDSVYLNAYTNLKEVGTGKDRYYTYSNFVNIGEYDKDSEFRVSDIGTALKTKLYNNVYLLTMFLAAVFAMGIIGLSRLKFVEHSSEEKPTTEIVDSIANKTQTNSKDSAKATRLVHSKKIY